MGKIAMLALANIRKGISQTVSLFILVFIASILLSVGLVLSIQFGSYFDERVEELNAPHLAIIQSKDVTTKQQERYLADYPGATETENVPILSTTGEYYIDDLKTTAVLIFANVETKQDMNPPLLIGESLPLDDESIYVPYLMKVTGAYELGDDYQLILGGKTKSYTIAGFTEDVMYGSLMNTLYRYYLSDRAYQDLEELYPSFACDLLQVRLDEADASLQLEIDYLQEFFFSQEVDETSPVFVQAIKISDVKAARTSIPSIMSGLMMAFSLILLLICLVVIRFRIVNNIEENLRDIGALKALGYTSNQIIASIVLQFTGIAMAACVVGLFSAQAVLPTAAQMLESQTALVWNPDFDLGLTLMSFAIICGVIALTALMVSRRIKKLDTLVALRSGAATHSFKRNRLPLATAGGPLTLLLAMKELLNKKRQAVMIMFIIAFVTFASVATVAIYYNIGVEPTMFIRIIAGELPDAGLLLEDSAQTQGVIERIEDDSRVRKVFRYQNEDLSVDDITVTTIVTEDFSLFEGNMLAEGRYPVHDNEVALGGNSAKVLNKNIGDTVSVSHGGQTKEYYVTGIIQLMHSGGINMAMTKDGITELWSTYESDQIYIYLYDEEDVAGFLKSVTAREGDIFSSVVNMKEMTTAQFSSYGSIFGVLTAVIVVVTTVVILLVLLMVMRTSIVQRKREFGILKAIGFSTAQLVQQLALNYLPILFVGVAVGGVAGYFFFNPLFVFIISNFGILKVELPTPLSWTLAVCLFMLIVAYLVSLLIALRIRKISPYALVSE